MFALVLKAEFELCPAPERGRMELEAEWMAEFGPEPATMTSGRAPQAPPKLPDISSRFLLRAVFSSQLSVLSNPRRIVLFDSLQRGTGDLRLRLLLLITDD